MSSDDQARYWTYITCLSASGIGGTIVTDGLVDMGLAPYNHFNWYQSRLAAPTPPNCGIVIDPNP